MAGLSIMNEFAKYAKLQRRYNQLENILKENGKFISFFFFIILFIEGYFDKTS